MATSTRGTTIATVLAMTAFAAAMACALLLVGRYAADPGWARGCQPCYPAESSWGSAWLGMRLDSC